MVVTQFVELSRVELVLLPVEEHLKLDFLLK